MEHVRIYIKYYYNKKNYSLTFKIVFLKMKFNLHDQFLRFDFKLYFLSIKLQCQTRPQLKASQTRIHFQEMSVVIRAIRPMYFFKKKE
jgi:hypothetical protein